MEERVRKQTFPDLMLSSKVLCESVKVKDIMCKSNLGVARCMIFRKKIKRSKKKVMYWKCGHFSKLLDSW